MLATVARVAVVAVAALLILGASFAVGGQLGLVIAADCLAALALVVALARTPSGMRERGVLRPAVTWARAIEQRIWPRHAAPAAVRPSDFPAYTKISSDLSWAPVDEVQVVGHPRRDEVLRRREREAVLLGAGAAREGHHREHADHLNLGPHRSPLPRQDSE